MKSILKLGKVSYQQTRKIMNETNSPLAILNERLKSLELFLFIWAILLLDSRANKNILK